MNEIAISTDKKFSRALFGLNRTEVYKYLNEIGGVCEELQFQVDILKEQNNKLSDSNRENALKIYNMQNDITEAQKKSDRASYELEAAKKEAAALRQELEIAEKRIRKLTDDLIRAGVNTDASATATPIVEEKKEFTSDTTFSFDFDKPVESTPKEETNDIFAEMKKSVMQEQAAQTQASASTASTVSSADAFDSDEVYAGEVEVKVDESMLIGNEDDQAEGFTFL